LREGKPNPFFARLGFRVTTGAGVEPYKFPTTEIDNPTLFYAVKLAKAGYYGGNPENVLNAPVDMVLSILGYENFEADYQRAFKHINTGKS
jgi:hypothetical protein